MGSRLARLGIVLATLAGACAPNQVTPDQAPGAPSAKPVETTPQVESRRRPRLRPMAPALRPMIQKIGEGRLEAARGLALDHLEEHGQDGQAAFLVGLSFEKAGNFGAARPWFQRALRDAPDYFILHDYLGRTQLMLGQLEAARHEFEAFAGIDPLEPKAVYGLGLIELEHTRLEPAATEFRRALELFEILKKENPPMYRARASERAQCYARLADVHFARDEYEAARENLLQATTIAPDNISAFYALSLVHRRIGDDASADRALARYETRRKELSEVQGDR